MPTVTYIGPTSALVAAGRRFPKGVPVEVSEQDADEAKQATRADRLRVVDDRKEVDHEYVQ